MTFITLLHATPGETSLLSAASGRLLANADGRLSVCDLDCCPVNYVCGCPFGPIVYVDVGLCGSYTITLRYKGQGFYSSGIQVGIWEGEGSLVSAIVRFRLMCLYADQPVSYWGLQFDACGNPTHWYDWSYLSTFGWAAGPTSCPATTWPYTYTTAPPSACGTCMSSLSISIRP